MSNTWSFIGASEGCVIKVNSDRRSFQSVLLGIFLSVFTSSGIFSLVRSFLVGAAWALPLIRVNRWLGRAFFTTESIDSVSRSAGRLASSAPPSRSLVFWAKRGHNLDHLPRMSGFVKSAPPTTLGEALQPLTARHLSCTGNLV